MEVFSKKRCCCWSPLTVSAAVNLEASVWRLLLYETIRYPGRGEIKICVWRFRREAEQRDVAAAMSQWNTTQYSGTFSILLASDLTFSFMIDFPPSLSSLYFCSASVKPPFQLLWDSGSYQVWVECVPGVRLKLTSVSLKVASSPGRPRPNQKTQKHFEPSRTSSLFRCSSVKRNSPTSLLTFSSYLFRWVSNLR